MSRTLTPILSETQPSLKDVKRVFTPEDFEKLCTENRDLRLELTSTGDLIVMPPTGSKTGLRNANLTYQLAAWTNTDDSGVCFDSSTIFALPNNAQRSPDAAWVNRERWGQLSEREQEGFAPLCPDFVVELRSPSDRLEVLQAKMGEYIENGSQLGWLIDPFERRVYVYKPDSPLKILENPATVSGESLMPGFELKLASLW